MEICEKADYIYPMLVDIYYPIVDQGPYGNLQKQWVFDRTVACNFSSTGSASKEDVKPNVNITKEMILVGRVKNDLRISDENNKNSITNIVLTNIRAGNNAEIYMETSGPRSGRSTIFEIASQEPVFGPFRDIEYYKVVIRRSENQATDL